MNIDIVGEENFLLNAKDSIFYPFYIIKNAVQINFLRNEDTWRIVRKCDEEDIKTIYLRIFNDDQSDAFAHWVFESAIFLPLYIELCQKFPSLDIVLWQLNDRKFRNLFYKYFGIKKIFTGPLSSATSTSVLLCPPINTLNSLKHKTEALSTFGSKIFNTFVEIFHEHVSFNGSIRNKILVMPRQSRENYRPNDRGYDFSGLIKHVLLMDEVQILETDRIEDLEEQINFIMNSKTIILCDGSSFLVNGLLFCMDKNIIVVDNITVGQSEKFVQTKNLVDIIQKNNKVIRISSPSEAIKLI